MQDIKRDCVVQLEKMEISRSYELDRAEDAVFGGETLLTKRKEPSHQALVFMIEGVKQLHKQVIAYHFTETGIDVLIPKQ
ncbi:hypothetical protein HPB48_018315 [Haemaphysalis longicornis]|uniref:Transposable element P transposase-like RNase H domain-containing protein n=1 Tax=Haemaphysalis longicornis TaxID=44386 RepID=A0A9J6GTS9_HAELO|nr:hypothetical protein HPB48_018315 [Haemaphysalis longicornis]